MDPQKEFDAIYEKYSGSRPLYKFLNEITSGIPRWRLHILERGTSPTGGDREILCVEKPTRDECLIRATKILKERMESEQKAEKEAI